MAKSKTPRKSKASISDSEKTWATFVHLSAFLVFVTVVVPPLGAVIGPLIVWLLKKKEMPFVDDQGKEAINFNLSVLVYALVSALFIFILVGLPLLIFVFCFWFIFVVIAAVKANKGNYYRYPLTIRFLS